MHSKSCGECLGNLMPEDLRDELSSPWLTGRVENRSGRPDLKNASTGQKGNSRRHLADEAHFVRHDQHGHALPREQADEIEDFRYEFWIECRGDLIKEQDFRLESQRPRDSDALLLPP